MQSASLIALGSFDIGAPSDLPPARKIGYGRWLDKVARTKISINQRGRTHVVPRSSTRFRIRRRRSLVSLDLSSNRIDHICCDPCRCWHHGPRVFLRDFTANDALTHVAAAHLRCQDFSAMPRQPYLQFVPTTDQPISMLAPKLLANDMS
jgi:hypothetical protein